MFLLGILSLEARYNMIGLSKLFKISLVLESHLLCIVKGNLIWLEHGQPFKIHIHSAGVNGVQWAKFQLISVLEFSSSSTCIENTQKTLSLAGTKLLPKVLYMTF